MDIITERDGNSYWTFLKGRSYPLWDSSGSIGTRGENRGIYLGRVMDPKLERVEVFVNFDGDRKLKVICSKIASPVMFVADAGDDESSFPYVSAFGINRVAKKTQKMIFAKLKEMGERAGICWVPGVVDGYRSNEIYEEAHKRRFE